FEGVLRKWIFPQWGRQLFFIRDPFAILIYALVFVHRTKLPRSRFKEIEFAFAAAGLGLCAFQLLAGSRLPAYFLLYGWRNYFLYMPLAFVSARYFNMWDVAQLARRTLIASLPMALLVLAQLNGGATSPVNGGLGEGPNAVYVMHTTEDGVVRPAGTFTSD